MFDEDAEDIVLSHNELLDFARKHKDEIELKTADVISDLKRLNEEFENNAPIVRNRKEFNERFYDI